MGDNPTTASAGSQSSLTTTSFIYSNSPSPSPDVSYGTSQNLSFEAPSPRTLLGDEIAYANDPAAVAILKIRKLLKKVSYANSAMYNCRPKTPAPSHASSPDSCGPPLSSSPAPSIPAEQYIKEATGYFFLVVDSYC